MRIHRRQSEFFLIALNKTDYRRWQRSQEVGLVAKNVAQCAQIINANVYDLFTTVFSYADCPVVLFALHICFISFHYLFT